MVNVKLLFGILAIFALVRCASTSPQDQGLMSELSNNPASGDTTNNGDTTASDNSDATLGDNSDATGDSSDATLGDNSDPTGADSGPATSSANNSSDQDFGDLNNSDFSDFDSNNSQSSATPSAKDRQVQKAAQNTQGQSTAQQGGSQSAQPSQDQANDLQDLESPQQSSQQSSQAQQTDAAPISPETPPAPADEAPSTIVKSIRFISNPNGGTVEIKTDQPTEYTIRTNRANNQTVVEIPNSKLSQQLQRPFIMKDFDTPFGAINAYENPGGNVARIVVQMKGTAQPVVSQVDNSILLTPSTQPSQAVAEGDSAAVTYTSGDKASYDTSAAKTSEQILGARTLDEFLTGSNKFFGRPISIETDDADVREVIKFIADESGVNIVIADDVQGKISLKLRQVPWDQALVIVMRSKDLGYIRQGNVLRITKLSTLQSEAKEAKAIVDAQANLTPMKVKVIPVSYANVQDLEKQIKPFLTPTRGQVVSDPRTSSIIITDTADVLARVSRLIKALDIPPAQVMIEGKVVEADEGFSRDIGVNWGFSGVQTMVSSSGGYSGSPISYLAGLNVSPLPSSGSGGYAGGLGNASLNVGVLNFVGDLQAALALAQTDDLVRIISAPRIVTMNKEKAEIVQKGQTIYVTHIIDTQTQTTESQPVMKDWELHLTVTPQITAEGSVILDVDLVRQYPGAVADPSSGARPINTRQATTKVLVPNGQTAVIGGIYQSDETNSNQGVPWLKDLPGIGWLFSYKHSDRSRAELLLFLTPRILNSQEQAASTGDTTGGLTMPASATAGSANGGT